MKVSDILTDEFESTVVRESLKESYEYMLKSSSDFDDGHVLCWAIRKVLQYYSTEAQYNDFLAQYESHDKEEYFDNGSADAEALASAGWGTDEDYNYYGEYD